MAVRIQYSIQLVRMTQGVPRSEKRIGQCQQRKRIARVARYMVWSCYGAVAFSIFGLLGGWEAVRNFTPEIHHPTWLDFPNNLAYLLPLLIPFTTYIVIARWTGDTMFRHS